MLINGRPLVKGEAEGSLLLLTEPACFWGGLDPTTGVLSDPRHPQYGKSIADRIVAIPAIVGSSSSSQFLLEAMYLGNAPRAILLGEEEIIIATAVFVGHELGYPEFPIVCCDFFDLRDGSQVTINTDGSIESD